jgi:hypothetical protein
MTAGTAHFYAPDRPVFFADGRGALIRFDNRMFSLPKRERQLTDGTMMRGFLVSNGLIVDARIALRAVERVVLFPTSCDTDRGASLEHLLTCLGFRNAETPNLSRPVRSVIESSVTQLSLWLRDRQISDDASCRN